MDETLPCSYRIWTAREFNLYNLKITQLKWTMCQTATVFLLTPQAPSRLSYQSISMSCPAPLAIQVC